MIRLLITNDSPSGAITYKVKEPTISSTEKNIITRYRWLTEEEMEKYMYEKHRHRRLFLDAEQVINGSIFRVTGPLALGGVWNPPVTGENPWQRPVTRGFGVFFDLRLNKRLSKQLRCWWFGTPWRSLWCHCNDPVSWHRHYPRRP